MTPCPHCGKDVDGTPAISLRKLPGFAEHLSSDARGFYKVVEKPDCDDGGWQYLIGQIAVSPAQHLVHDDAVDRARDALAKRMAHAYNAVVQKGLVEPGVMMEASCVALARMDLRHRELGLLYVRTRHPMAVLNDALGGFPLFVQEGNVGDPDVLEAYAAANGLP